MAAERFARLGTLLLAAATALIPAAQARADLPKSPPPPAPDITLSTAAPETAAPVPGLGLREALDRALRQSSLIEAARASTAVFAARLDAAEAIQYPRLKMDTLIAPMPAHRGNPIQGHTDMSDWGVILYGELSGYQPLYTFGKIEHLLKASRLGVEVGKAQEAIARAEVRYKVLKGFFGLSLARELHAVMDEGRGYFDKAKRHVRSLKQADDPSFDPVDEMKIRVYDAQLLSRELEVARLSALALASLRQSIGENPQAGPGIATSAPQPLVPLREVTMEQAIQAAVDARPELVALRTGVQARSEEAKARYWAMYPDIVLAGKFSITYNNNADHQPSPFAYNPYNGWNLGGGLALRWDLDLGKKLGEWREAKANRRKLVADLDEAERNVRLEVEKLYREMADARSLVGAQQDAMKAARGWVVSKLDLYENDLATLRDVLDGLMPFFQARLDLLKAIHDYDVSVAALERATGLELVPLDAPPAGNAADPPRE